MKRSEVEGEYWAQKVAAWRLEAMAEGRAPFAQDRALDELAEQTDVWNLFQVNEVRVWPDTWTRWYWPDPWSAVLNALTVALLALAVLRLTGG